MLSQPNRPYQTNQQWCLQIPREESSAEPSQAAKDYPGEAWRERRERG
uniref:Uncharacterized protein n=1 Tax=Lotus japonicus TaxID=34305 RepID=I3SMP5_LOTJA|nr:unknown [Lotus japonicus]